ncbi:MAG: glucose 1-dehydrogenase [Rhodospirillales bacterium]|nr:glucose 1-dehydrogenase [Rhodospirillales bacterium]
MTPLKGKTAIVSGAAHGIGAAEARALVAAGASVVVGDLLDGEGEALVAEINASAGAQIAHYRHLDVTRADDWAKTVAASADRFGPPTLLVNNAGIPARSGIEEATEQEWDRTIAVDVTGTWLGMKACIPAMRAAGGGAIVNTSSHYGLVASGRAVTYHSAKAAVMMLTKAAAVEYARQNIRVNSIHPGLTDTPRIATLPAAWKQSMLDQVPLRRIADPSEIASVVVFLLSQDASYITGASVVIDGGLTAI